MHIKYHNVLLLVLVISSTLSPTAFASALVRDLLCYWHFGFGCNTDEFRKTTSSTSNSTDTCSNETSSTTTMDNLEVSTKENQNETTTMESTTTISTESEKNWTKPTVSPSFLTKVMCYLHFRTLCT
ncbi:hypothetical protein EWB00_001478 [Schistosoma japonicum]|uniref:Uncharacterized protein n=1 Tax=Schistosoma japonicum TaxID=6182 RepID=A0A4Z2DFF7_SCHJA|nr:hypothetical protein EWB00_001478 [Schistosoma japonicum]